MGKLFNSTYAEPGTCIGFVDYDGKVYTSDYAENRAFIGYVTYDGRVYESANSNGGTFLGFVAYDGHVYTSHCPGYHNCMGKVGTDGSVYDSYYELFDRTVGFVEGGNIKESGGAFLLFRKRLLRNCTGFRQQDSVGNVREIQNEKTPDSPKKRNRKETVRMILVCLMLALCLAAEIAALNNDFVFVTICLSAAALLLVIFVLLRKKEKKK